MTFTEAVLIVIVLIILYFYIRQKNEDAEESTDSEDVDLKENFTSNACPTDAWSGKLPDGCMIGDNEDPGWDFASWTSSQVIDSQTVKNHREFVKDRLKNKSQNIIGRARPSDSLEVTPVPWVGLRRPQKVPIGNFPMIADVDYNWYADKQTLRW